MKEFREFISRGNVLDLAVAVVIGAAFGAVTTSLVNQVIMPIVGLALGGVDFANLGIILKDQDLYPSVASAVEAGAPVIQYGAFINTIINFLIIARHRTRATADMATDQVALSRGSSTRVAPGRRGSPAPWRPAPPSRAP
ncbi:MAG: large conductance mechanosensitive channel protein MscL [Trueperaceae bacterium]